MTGCATKLEAKDCEAKRLQFLQVARGWAAKSLWGGNFWLEICTAQHDLKMFLIVFVWSAWSCRSHEKPWLSETNNCHFWQDAYAGAKRNTHTAWVMSFLACGLWAGSAVKRHALWKELFPRLVKIHERTMIFSEYCKSNWHRLNII